MSIVIRRALLSDSTAISLLSEQLSYPAPATTMQKRLEYILGHDEHCVYVATEEAMICGWIHVFYSATIELDPCVEIAGLVIDETKRRKGIGQQLVDEVTAWARTKGVRKVRVRSRMMRKDAHSFYTGIGFIEVKEQKVFDLNI